MIKFNDIGEIVVTLKKIDMFISNLSIMDLKCPICASQMNLIGKSLVCTKKHTYDINKKGYVKLLKIQKPYDDKLYTNDLFVSRRNVIEKTYEISEDIANEFLNMTPLTERLNQKNTMNKITISLRIIVGAKL